MAGSTFFLVNVAGLTTTNAALALGDGAANSPVTGSQLSIQPGWKVGTSTAGKSSPMSTGGGGIQPASSFVTSPASPPATGPTAGSLGDCYVGSVDTNGDTLPKTGTFASGTVVTASFSLRASGTAVSGSIKMAFRLWMATQPSGETHDNVNNLTQITSGTVNTGNSGAISTSASTVVTGNFTLGSTLTLQGHHLFLEVAAVVVTASSSANAEFVIEQNSNSFLNFSNSFVADTLGRIQTLSGDTSSPTGPITTAGFGLPVRTNDIIVVTILRTPQTVGGDVLSVKDSSTGTPAYTSLLADVLGDSQALMTSFWGHVATSTTAIGMTVTFTLSLSGGNSDASGIIEWTLAVYRSSGATPTFGSSAGNGNAAGSPVTVLSCGPLNVPAGALVYVFGTHQSGGTNFTFTDGTTIAIDDEAANDRVGEGRFPSSNASFSPQLTSTGGANGAQIMAQIIQLPAATLSDFAEIIGSSVAERPPLRAPIESTFPLDDRSVILSELNRWGVEDPVRRPIEPPPDPGFLSTTVAVVTTTEFPGGWGNDVAARPSPRIVEGQGTLGAALALAELDQWTNDVAAKPRILPPPDPPFLGSPMTFAPTRFNWWPEPPVKPPVRVDMQPAFLGTSMVATAFALWPSPPDRGPPPRPPPEPMWEGSPMTFAPTPFSVWPEAPARPPLKAPTDPGFLAPSLALGEFVPGSSEPSPPKPVRPLQDAPWVGANVAPPAVRELLQFGNDVEPPRPKAFRPEDTPWIGAHMGTFVAEISEWTNDQPAPVRRWPTHDTAYMQVLNLNVLRNLGQWTNDLASPVYRWPAHETPFLGAHMTFAPALFSTWSEEPKRPSRAYPPEVGWLGSSSFTGTFSVWPEEQKRPPRAYPSEAGWLGASFASTFPAWPGEVPYVPPRRPGHANADFLAPALSPLAKLSAWGSVGTELPPRSRAAEVAWLGNRMVLSLFEGLGFGNDPEPPRPKIWRTEDTPWIGAHIGSFLAVLSQWTNDVAAPVRRLPTHETSWLGTSFVVVPVANPLPLLGSSLFTPGLYEDPEELLERWARAEDEDAVALPPRGEMVGLEWSPGVDRWGLERRWGSEEGPPEEYSSAMEPPALESRVRRVRRRVFRGDTLYFGDQVFVDTVTGERFTAPDVQRRPPRAIPQDLTGARVVMTVKYQVPDPDAAALLQIDNMALGGITVAVPTSGGILVNSPANVAILGLADGVVEVEYDIQVKDASGRVSTVELGVIDFRPDVTRSS